MNVVLRDTISCVVMCADGCCLCKVSNGFVFLISSTAHSTAWLEQAYTDIKTISSLEATKLEIFKWFKIAIPTIEYTFTYVTSIVFKTQVTSEQKRNSKLLNGYEWLNFRQLQNFYGRKAITSPIFLELYPNLSKVSLFTYEAYQGEFLQFAWIVQVSNNTLYIKNSTQSEMFINKTNVKPIQMDLCKDFFATCMPNVLMSLYHFTSIMMKFGLKSNLVLQLFRAADSLNMSFISYRDFACALAVVDPATEHKGQAAEFRKRYIFRMFDEDNDKFLNRAELEALLNFVRSSKDPDIRSCLDTMKAKKLSLTEFSRSIDTLRLNGLAATLRSTKNCINMYDDETYSNDYDSQAADFTLMQRQQVQELDENENYNLASHTLRIMKSGNVIENISSLQEVCSSNTLEQADITQESCRLSCEISSPTILFDELIQDLRVLTHLNNLQSGNRGNKLEDFDWGAISELLYARRLIQVCSSLRRVVMEEKRMLELKSPVYVLGALHGNYGDLAYFERILWPRCPGYCPGAILCLGNYVDRVPYGIEVISYLFCYKNLYPYKVFLLRGNHEHRKIQQKDCFFEECLRKFGPALGRDVWEAVNSVFDCLPLAAVIDDKLFCVNSGVPNPNVCKLTKFLNNIPLPLVDPEHGSALAWEILWNEPFKQVTGRSEQSDEGFAANIRVGTGYTFTNDALNQFLDTNFLSHLIRGSEPVSSGFTFSDKGRILSVFSTSNYSNFNNDGACLLADKGKIRGIRLCIKR